MIKKIFLFQFIVLCLSSCGQDYNSNYNDRGTYADIGIPPGDPLYNPYVILQNKCFSCHSSEWQNYKTSAQWVNAGLVTPGNYNISKLKVNLKNYGGTMPPEPTSPLLSSELEILRVWINNL